MATDLFEQLAETKVPPVPEEMDQNIHQQLNWRLLVSHMMDLFFRGMPLVCFHFGHAVLGLIKFSLLGRFDEKR